MPSGYQPLNTNTLSGKEIKQCQFVQDSIKSSKSPQQGDFRFSGPPSSLGAGGETRTRDRRVPAGPRADSRATVPTRLSMA
ncbi:hypothetical protein PoB_006465300 [Plakobranchus ocellatus]|uniref:Uncharacterized protein n=1 Tax=Plakobranchus ocellatus TaxID=259542 RepID=A0AAV4D1X1_9GAST|nr:hypothetical protein PoB_006465300 [Plakobranchus ocellatus]